MRISDWSSDVCSSDLEALTTALGEQQAERKRLDDSTDDSILADAAELEAESRTLTAARSNEKDARTALDTARKADQEHVTQLTVAARAVEVTAEAVTTAKADLQQARDEIGRASCRERGCTDVSRTGGAASIKKKKN